MTANLEWNGLKSVSDRGTWGFRMLILRTGALKMKPRNALTPEALR